MPPSKRHVFTTETFDDMERSLYSAVISDVLDDFGVRDHSLREGIAPLKEDDVVAGRAATILYSKTAPKGQTKNPYSAIIKFVDGLRTDDVVVMGGSECDTTALWGELLSTASLARGSRGAVIDGYTRDTKKVLELDYPVFALGKLPDDSKGRADVVSQGRPIKSGRATIKPGDIIFGDTDGIVSIPQAIASTVITEAFSKAGKENLVRDGLRRGLLLKDLWRKYRVL